MTENTNAKIADEGAHARFDRIVTKERLESDDESLLLALTNEQIRIHPHRDPDKLQTAWNEHGSVTGVAEELDCSMSAASKWLHSYGIRTKDAGNRPKFVQDMIAAERGRSA